MNLALRLIIVAAGMLASVAVRGEVGAFPVAIQVDASRSVGKLQPVWRFFGADEPNYAYMKDGRKLLGELGELRRGEVFFRTHNLLNSGDGTPALKWGSTGAYREDAAGKPIYDWTIVDKIFDTYLERGVRPYAQIGFMPRELSRKPEPYQHKWSPKARYDEIYTGWSHPPRDYKKWEELVYQWAWHCVERYGADEVERWYWETWNEPNIGYWQGTPEEFHELHDHAIAAVRRALPTARVGGPDVAGDGGQFMRDFLRHCVEGTNYATGEKGTPLDFVSFHAKGQPEHVDGHVRMGISNQLRTIDAGFRIVASFPQLKQTPIVIGESDPEGCAACQGPQLSYRNTTMYSSYTAASFARKHELAGRHGVNLEGVLTWAFEFEDQPYFAGFRALATNGIDLPVLNVFRMFARMPGERLSVESDSAVTLDQMLKNGVRERPDVSAFACRDDDKLCILVWHYHDDDVPGPAAGVTLSINHYEHEDSPLAVRQFRVDGEHGNAYTVWQRMGEPQQPTPDQYAELERAGRLAEISPPALVRSGEHRLDLEFTLPRQGVALFEISHQPGDTTQ